MYIRTKNISWCTLTSTQVLLLVLSGTGLIHLLPLSYGLWASTLREKLIWACLNAIHGSFPSSMPVGIPLSCSGFLPLSMCASATLSHSLDTMPGAPANNILGLPSGYFTEWRSLGTRAFVPPQFRYIYPSIAFSLLTHWALVQAMTMVLLWMSVWKFLMS